jgi:putative methionine-R-sulfoxide reductase with GAF domain
MHSSKQTNNLDKKKSLISQENRNEYKKTEIEILKQKLSQLEKENDQYKNNNQQLLKLMDITNKLNSTLDKKVVLNTLLGAIARLMNADAISIFLEDKKKKELVLEASNNIDMSISSNIIRVPMGKGICGYAYEHNEIVNIPDVSKDKRFFSEADKKTGFITKSLIAVPIMWQDEVIGVSQCINKKDGSYFTKEDEQIFIKLLGQASTAIVNAKLYSEVLEKQDRITERNDKLLKLTYSAYEITTNIKTSFKKFKDVFEISKRLSEISNSGKDIIFSILEEIKKISNSANNTTKTVEKLNLSIENITTYIKDIDEIADTTNVLSINAGIQAARAGSYGRAFAVVVDEIRTLSQNTRQVTQNITEATNLITELSSQINHSMKTENKEIESETEKVNRGVESIKEIQDVIDNMLEDMREINRINNTQNQSAEKMLEEIEKINLFDIDA